MSKIFVTKYALTVGIYEAGAGTRVVVKTHGKYTYAGCVQCKMGKDAFVSRDEAESEARAMAARKIVSLQKGIHKMEALRAVPKWKAE